MAMVSVGGKSNSRIVKWSETPVGTVYAGIYNGMRAGQFGPLADVHTEDEGDLALPAATVLHRKLSCVRTGAFVRIEYLGMQKSKTATYHDHDVQCDAADVLPEPSTQELKGSKRGA